MILLDLFRVSVMKEWEKKKKLKNSVLCWDYVPSYPVRVSRCKCQSLSRNTHETTLSTKELMILSWENGVKCIRRKRNHSNCLLSTCFKRVLDLMQISSLPMGLCGFFLFSWVQYRSYTGGAIKSARGKCILTLALRHAPERHPWAKLEIKGLRIWCGWGFLLTNQSAWPY